VAYSDKELRTNALLMWANHIETGDVTLSAADLAERSRAVVTKAAKQPRALDEGQIALVTRLRALAKAEQAAR
jgi:hypothetical protein